MVVSEVGSENDFLKTKHNYQTRIPNQHILLISASGYGKSTGTERLIQDFYRNKYTVLYVCDIKRDLEGAFCQFPPRESYHLKDLKTHKENPKTYPVKIYHPFTFDIPNKKIPETNFFTIPIKNLTDKEIKFLLEEPEENITFKMLFNILRRLQSNEGIYHYIKRIEKSTQRVTRRIGKERIRMSDPTRFFTKGTTAGTILQLSDIVGLFQRFDYHYFLAEENSKYNLDIRKVLNDQKNIHVFTTRYIGDSDKVRDFVTFYLVREIIDHIEESKYPILLIFPEVRVLVPKNPKGHKKILSSLLKDFLSIARGENISTISNSQLFSKVDDDVVNSFTDILLGYTSSEDILYCSQAFKLRRDVAEGLRELNQGEFYCLKFLDEGVWKLCMPKFMHKEEHYHYDEVFERFFPERMKSYRDLIQEFKEGRYKVQQELKDEVKREFEMRKQSIEKEIKEKEKKLKEREEIERLKEEKKEIKKISTEERDGLIFELDRERLSYRKIGNVLKDKYGIKISHVAISKIIKKKKEEDVNSEKKILDSL